MRVLTFSRESYPAEFSTSYVLTHLGMALEHLGHESHLYNVNRRPMRLLDYLQAYEFDLILLDVDFLHADDVWRTLRQFRRQEPVRIAGALFRLPPPPPGPAWDIMDLVFTPWKGEAVRKLASSQDVRYLPLGYNTRMHTRKTELPPLGPVFVGNTTGAKRLQSEAYLEALRNERIVLCLGPGFEQKALDPLMLGPVYAAARCLPNFHYSWEKGDDTILNERFWQTARCGIPVNDCTPLMRELWDRTLLENFAFADKREWQDRIRALQAGAVALEPALIEKLNRSMAGHSYEDRVKTLLAWFE